MKKSWLALLAVPVVAYPAAAWYFGAQVQSTLDAQYKHAQTLPYAKIVERTYARGVFKSSESVTIELFGDMMRAIHQATAGSADGVPGQAVRIRISSQIAHGPFAGGALAAAVVDSALVLDADTQAKAATLLGDLPPLSSHTVFDFDGSGTASVVSPAFSAQFANPETGKPVTIAWEGITADVDFAPNMVRYSLRGAAPKFEVKDAAGSHMVMTGMRFSGDLQRIFDDEPLLFAGSQRFAIDEMQMNMAGAQERRAALKRISYDIDMPVTGDFIDIAARMGAEVVDIGGIDYGPAHYDLSLKHLHARSIAKLYRVMLDAYSSPAMIDPKSDPGLALAPLAQPAMALLAHNPSFQLDRLSFTTPHGDAHLDLHASAPGIAPAAMSNPGMIMAVLEAGANIAVPEALLLGMFKERAGAQMAAMSKTGSVSEQDMQVLVAQLESQLQQLSGQGFITRENGVVKSTATLRAGQLSFNGRPFNPMTMQ